ncbi:PREDICTED: uncharacterized protein LOC105449777 [Wasmannia auropunctata]|uniref:uncharacterized protein LOC105449777 n=1 Tax=Wasmannia auropunctata TaxID=64793 RepID=UPI0005EE00C8|nr:PREDICTED: uncharacterized protein LOC105449777 [Wasmannia auropunctata]
MSDEEEQAFGKIGRIAIKSPPFWPEEPDIWFNQIESQFVLGGVTQDSTKYAYVLSQLEAKYAKEVKDVVTNPPERGKYQALKNALIQRLCASQEQRIRQLLEHEEIGDRKPSQFLRHLQTLAGAVVSDQLLRTLWLGRLPTQMQVILATRSEDRLEDVAEQADKIHEVSGKAVVAAASTSTATKSLEMQVQELAKQIAALTTKFSKKKRWERSRSRSRNRYEGQRKQKEICYYHRRFKAEAKKCTKPCNFKSENEEGSR